MAQSPEALADRFQPVTRQDLRALRSFFSKLLDHGGEIFDELNPFHDALRLDCVPHYDAWTARSKGKVVAAGWFQFISGSEIRVVALAHPDHDFLVDPLLAYIEAALKVIAYQGPVTLGAINAWLPQDPHGARLEATYAQRGWTFVSRPWLARVGRAELCREVLIDTLAQARASGLTIRPISEAINLGQGVQAGITDPELVDRSVWEALEGGQLLAVNGEVIVEPYGRMVNMTPSWSAGVARSQLVERALLAATMLEPNKLPDVLVGTGDFSEVAHWFRGAVEVEVRDGYMFEIDASIKPTAWEYALGVNPKRYRIWLV